MELEPEQIALILRYLELTGLTFVSPLRPNWRHYVAIVTHPRHKGQLHLKMTRLVELAAERTANEIAALQVLDSLREKAKLPYKVAEIFKSGIAGDAPYFVGTYFRGLTLVSQALYKGEGRSDSYDTTLLEKHLNTVVSVALNVTYAAWPALPLDKRWNSPERYGQDAARAMHQIEEKMGRQPQLKPLVALANTVKEYWATSPKIGDFDPWHCFEPDENGIMPIIDLEAAASAAPRFHDIAYIVARLCERGDKLELAARLIQLYFNGLDERDRHLFRTLGKALIGLRCLTSYLDSPCNSTFHDRLRQALIGGTFIP